MIDQNPERQLTSRSPDETLAVGRALGAALQRGDVLALDGDLGAGKTVLVRGLAEGLGADPAAVRSPTFVLHHIHRGVGVTLHHLDCYRLGAGADLDSLDIEALADDGAVAVEWAEYAPALSRFSPLHVHIDVLDESHRRLTFSDVPPHLAAALDTQSGGGV